MKYHESEIDKQLRSRFLKDFSYPSLRKIFLAVGSLRGITPMTIDFDFPITAIAGRNGTGKSTLLAMASCAFHNIKNGFKLAKRRTPYYTFSDFFVQHADEVSPQGIKIYYLIGFNNWVKSPNHPDGSGLAFQNRYKSHGGKWNDYDGRVERNVVFLGIDRIVPHSERSQSRSYSKVFKEAGIRGWEDKVKDAVGFILGRTYEKFRYVGHSKYSLPIVQSGSTVYSGFNMGAGENALFEIFSTIYACGKGSLLVLDEIELGLHAEAQRKLMEKLKQVCLETHTQIICTTHSKEIFDCLPNDARAFIEVVGKKTKIISGISSDFAFSKLSATPTPELTIFVEDEVASALLSSALPASIRTRIDIKAIGSASSLARQLAASYVRDKKNLVIAIFDGDQKSKHKDNYRASKNHIERVDADFEQWYSDRTAYLPGDHWPEAWIVQKCRSLLAELSKILMTDTDTLADILEEGLRAGKHREFHEIAKKLGLDKTHCMRLMTNHMGPHYKEDFTPLLEKIRVALDG